MLFYLNFNSPHDDIRMCLGNAFRAVSILNGCSIPKLFWVEKSLFHIL